MPPPPASAGQQSVLLAHYEKLGDGAAAYVDETYHVAFDGRARFYVMAAVVVPASDRGPLRSMLDTAVPGGFWHTTDRLQTHEGRDETRDLLRLLSPEYNSCVVVDQVEVHHEDKDGMQARGQVLGRLLTSLHHPEADRHESVELVVTEEHVIAKVNNFDRKVRADLVKDQTVSDSLRLTAVSPRSEHLLWLPDMVCSAYRQAKIGRGRDLFAEIEDITSVMHLPVLEVDTPNG